MREENKEQEYNLYKETIVEPKLKKYKKVLRGIKNVISVIVLSAIAAVVFVAVSDLVSVKKEEPTHTSDKITLNYEKNPSEEATSPSTSESESSTAPSTETDDEIENYKEFYSIASKIAQNAYRGMVTVSGIINTSQVFDTVNENITMGVIIAETNEAYYILTRYDTIKDADKVTVTLQSGGSAKAIFLKGDEVSNMAVVMVAQNSFSEQERASVKIIPLVNSSYVTTNTPVIAVGNVCNGNYSMNYGVISNTKNNIYDIDSKYKILNTNISCGVDSSGIVINTKGQLVGVITQNYTELYGENLISAYAIEDIKNTVEQLTNGKDILYIGIEGREITDSISNTYVMPRGIYILNIKANSPVATIGLQSGDIITAIDGSNVVTFSDLQQLIFNCEDGEEIILTVARRGSTGYREFEYKINLQVK